MSSSGVIVSPSYVPVGQPQPLGKGVSCTDTGIVATPFVVPPSPDIEQPCRQLHDSPMCRRHHLRLTVSNLSAESRRVRRATPSCRRRRMTVFVQVWILRILSAVVSRFRGQNNLLLCLHVRRSDLCCQPDHPVLPTGSVVRIFSHTAGGITYLCIGHSLVRPFRLDDSPIRRIRRYETNPPRYARWKPGIGITASSCSALRRRGMSEGHHSQRAAWNNCSSTVSHLFSLMYGRGLLLQSNVT